MAGAFVPYVSDAGIERQGSGKPSANHRMTNVDDLRVIGLVGQLDAVFARCILLFGVRKPILCLSIQLQQRRRRLWC